MKARLIFIGLCLSLLVNAVVLGFVWRHSHGAGSSVQGSQNIEALNVDIYDALLSRFRGISASTQCSFLLIGDSIPSLLAMDLEDRNEQGDLPASWSPTLRGGLGNRCIPSVTTLGLDQMLQKISLPPAKKVVLWTGVNDLMAGRSVDSILADYGDIVERVQRAEPGCQLTIVSVLPTRDGPFFNSSIRSLNLKLASLAGKKGARFLDVRSAVSDTAGYLDPHLSTMDGIHPSFAGLARIEGRLRTLIDGS